MQIFGLSMKADGVGLAQALLVSHSFLSDKRKLNLFKPFVKQGLNQRKIFSFPRSFEIWFFTLVIFTISVPPFHD